MPRSSARSASSPSSGTRTSTTMPRRRSGSRRSTRPTRSSATRNAASSTTCSAEPGSTVAAGPAASTARASGGSRTSSTPSSAARGRRGPAGATADRQRPPVRPPDHVRGGRPRHREGDRVPGPRPVRHVQRQRRQAGHPAGRVPAVQGPRRAAVDPPDDARPDGQRQPVPALSGRGQDRRDAVRDVPRRGPHGAPPDAPGLDPRGHRRGPPDPALERGRDRDLAAGRRARSTSRST